MAGGNASDVRQPWPMGEDSVLVFPVAFGAVTEGAAKVTLATFTLPFAAYCEKAEMSLASVTDTDGDSLVIVEDDTAVTTKKWVSAGDLGTTSATPVTKDLAVDKSVLINAGAVITVSVTGGDAGDAVGAGCLFLWLKPKKVR